MSGRHKDVDWNLDNDKGRIQSWECVQVAVLMDIRDELKRRNALLYCSNFVSIPLKLDKIGRNTAKPRKAKK